MSWLVFLQVILDLGLLLGLFLLWARMARPPREDLRLSKGLQLLQSKIAILEDLSDRTEVQVRQLAALLSAKTVEVQQKTAEADRQIQAIEKSMQKSLEISKIFQDRIPHREIIDRQTSFRYIEAARMAHRGISRDEISHKLEIPFEEVEIILNMNKEKFIFNEGEIPLWAQESGDASSAHDSILPAPSQRITEEIQAEEALVDIRHPIPQPRPTTVTSQEIKSSSGDSKDSKVRPYHFPRLDQIKAR